MTGGVENNISRLEKEVSQNNQQELSSKDLTKKLEEEAKKFLLKIENDKGSKLAKEEYNEFVNRVKQEQLNLKTSNQLEKDLEKEIRNKDLSEFKKDIEALDKIENLNGSSKFFDVLKSEFSERQQEKIYDKINRKKNIKSILKYLFGSETLPASKEGIKKMLKFNSKKEKKVLFKEIDNILNSSDSKNLGEEKNILDFYLQRLETLKRILPYKYIKEIDSKQKEIADKQNEITKKIEQEKEKEKKEEIEENQEKEKKNQEKEKKKKEEIEENQEKEKEKKEEIEENQEKEKEKKEEIEENQEKEKKIKDFTKKLEEFKKFDSLKGSVVLELVALGEKDVLDEKDFIKYEKLKKEFISFLRDKPKQLTLFVKEAAKKGGKELYTKAISFVKSLNDGILLQKLELIPDFDSITKGVEFPKSLGEFEKQQLLDSLGVDDLSKVMKNGNSFTFGDKHIVFEDGEFEMYTINPNTGYKLETEIGEIKNDYKKVDEFKTKISFIKEKYKEVGNDLNKLYLEKQQIEKKLKSGEKVTSSGEDLQKLLSDINLKIQEKKLYLQNLIKKAKEVTKNYKSFLKEHKFEVDKNKQEKQKEVLKFLHKTGFDLIPQQITDQLVREYQFNIYDIPGLNLNPERLDLANGIFGEEPTEEGGTKWKQNLVKFLNKLIYGETNPKNSPLNPDAFISPMGAAINPTELQAIFEEKGIKSGSMWNINKMRDNLKSQEQKEK